ncbi:DMT family transporter [Nocardioides coralli]|nr:DMT family transporter [Nocardioides coralli]
MTHDIRAVTPSSRLVPGLVFALLSAMSFASSGTLAKGLLASGWSPAAAVTARILVAALVLAVPGLIALDGRWGLLRRNLKLVVAYGVVAVAGCQFAYFVAIQHLQVGVALLIEYAAPVVVIGYLWFRYGQRPGSLTRAGTVVTLVGLALVLDLLSGADLHLGGMLWASLAMAGAAVYFILSAQEGSGLPPIVLAAGGMVVGSVALLTLGAFGLLEMRWNTDPAVYAGTEVPWWWAVLALGVVAAAIAYTTGIAATRRLGSRLASFVALLEVLFAMLYAWLVLGEQPQPVQVLGGLLVLTGVVLVKLGEPRTT